MNSKNYRGYTINEVKGEYGEVLHEVNHTDYTEGIYNVYATAHEARQAVNTHIAQNV